MRKLLATAAIAMIATSSADALVIHDDPGGNLGVRREMIAKLRRSGEKIILLGECASACTLILELPSSQVCATEEATLAFHGMMMAKRSGSAEPKLVRGKPVISPPIYQEAYMAGFAPQVKAWLIRSGALTRYEMTIVPATKFLQSCDDDLALGGGE